MKVWDALDIRITREQGDHYRVAVGDAEPIVMVVQDSLDVKLDDLIVTLALSPPRSFPWWHPDRWR